MADEHLGRLQLMRILARETEAGVGHLARCEACARVHRELAEVRDQGAHEAPRLALAPRPKPWFAQPWLVPAAAFAAMLLVVPRFFGDEIRAKGGLSLVASCKDEARIWPCAPGEKVRPGTAIMFEIDTSADRELMLLGRDVTKVWSTYLDDHGRSVSRKAGHGALMPNSLVLDASPGQECFLLVTAPQPFERKDVDPDGDRFPAESETATLCFEKKVE